jgi:hypothetical protein
MENRIKPLEPPDSLHLEAAEGWLELGNHLEANEELENITPQMRVHPDVLEMAAFAARVMMVNDSIVSLGGASSRSVSAWSRDGGLIHFSHKPAKQNGSPLFSITRNGCRLDDEISKKLLTALELADNLM